MKKALKVRRILMGILGSIITLLGFSGCGSMIPQADMYGSPYVEFELKGKVTDTKGDPVKDALISMKGKFSEKEDYRWITTPIYEVPYWQKYAIYTNGKGEYEISNRDASSYTFVRVICTPPESSGLEADSVDLKITYIKNKKADWYMGSYSGVTNFTLKAKPE